jgi:hypothetical protein
VHSGQHRLESVRRLIGHEPWFHHHRTWSEVTVTLGEVWTSHLAQPLVLGDQGKTATFAAIYAAGTIATFCTTSHIISARAALCAFTK